MAYTLVGRKGNTVRFDARQTGTIDKEKESYSSSVTSNPVENGAEINDHINNATGTLNISGVIIGGKSAINALKAMRDSRDIITYIGVTRMSNLVFTSLAFEYSSENKKGASFSATLKQVQTMTSEYVPMGTPLPMTSQDVGKSNNQQLAKTAHTGQTTTSFEAVSSNSAARHDNSYADIYKKESSTAPLTRITGGYNGLSSFK